MIKTVRLLAALSVFALGATAGTISQATTRIGLGANDIVQWGLVSDDGTFVLSPYNVVSAGGINLSAAVAGGLAIFVQNGSGGYVGAFSPGDILLDSGLNPGPITIDFATAVRGVGFDLGGVTNDRALALRTCDGFEEHRHRAHRPAVEDQVAHPRGGHVEAGPVRHVQRPVP